MPREGTDVLGNRWDRGGRSDRLALVWRGLALLIAMGYGGPVAGLEPASCSAHPHGVHTALSFPDGTSTVSTYTPLNHNVLATQQ